MDEYLKVIADSYGYDSQSRQLIEEMGELTVAINKFWRNTLWCGLKELETINTNREEYKNILEEIADVSICLEQVIYLLQCKDHIEIIKKQKILRQLKRIGTDPLGDKLSEVIEREEKRIGGK